MFHRRVIQYERLSIALVRFFSLLEFIFGGILNLTLAFISIHIGKFRLTCYVIKSTVIVESWSRAKYVPWGEVSNNAVNLLLHIWLDGLIALSSWIGIPEYTRHRIRYPVQVIHCIGHAILVVIGLQYILDWLDAQDHSERKWDFGQMTALASIGLAMSAIWVEYALGTSTVHNGMPRYCYWYLVGPTSCQIDSYQ